MSTNAPPNQVTKASIVRGHNNTSSRLVQCDLIECFTICNRKTLSEIGGPGAPPFSFRVDTNTGMFGVSADRIGFSTGGVLRMSIDSTFISIAGGIPLRVATNAGIADAAGNTFAAFFRDGAQDNIAAGVGGALSVTNYSTTVNTDGTDDAFTLADGPQVGQLKNVRLVVDGGGDAVITPVTLIGGTTLTMADAGDEVTLMWTTPGWALINNQGATLA